VLINNVAGSNQTMPSPGGQVSGMASGENCYGEGWVGGVRHPLDLPEGYHTPGRGQSRTAYASVPSRAAPGPACGRAVPGRRDAARTPACKIVGDHVEPMIVWTLYGHKTHPDNPIGPQTTSVCSRETRR
jgi:hypothetical protein